MATRRSRGVSLFSLIIILFLCILFTGLGWEISNIPKKAARLFGQPNPTLSNIELWVYSTQLLLRKNNILTAMDSTIIDIPFQVEIGESINSIANRLKNKGLIQNAEAFRLYLVYSGLDYKIQAGSYGINPTYNTIQIARFLTDSTPTEVEYIILAGWRIEEIAATMPTSGLMISPDNFVQYAKNEKPTLIQADDQLPESFEGFLFPGSYMVPRGISLKDLLLIFLDHFDKNVDESIREGFGQQNLGFYQAVILASMIEREAVMEEEQPIIASVFLNRMAAGMKLDSDPTVQYALGFNWDQNTWWTNPLSLEDLQIDSPYNTYLNSGLPPGPICNPGLSALKAAAFPAQTPYYYFRARCDGSGLHLFAVSFEEHLNNSCP
jgi:UPF0755 protein